MVSDIIHRSFSINLYVLRVLGIYYPGESYTRWGKVQACVIHGMFIASVPILSILYLLLEENLDFERFNYNAAVQAQLTGIMLKMLPFVINTKRIKRCIDYFNLDSFSELRENHRVILEACIKICRRNTIVFCFGAVGGMTSWALSPFFGKQRNLPIDVWLPFNALDNFYRYCIIYFLVVLGVFIAGLATCVVDPLITGLAYLATNNLEHLHQYAKEDCLRFSNTCRTRDDFIYQRIIQSVKHHRLILFFVKEYETCFSWAIFSQISASVFILCFTCLQITEIKSIDFNFLQFSTYIVFGLGQIFFYCYYGSTLSQESEAITNSIYMSKWYNYNVKNKKALRLLMENSTEPLQITAGKIADLSIVTFTTILKRSYSLLAVLKNY